MGLDFVYLCQYLNHLFSALMFPSHISLVSCGRQIPTSSAAHSPIGLNVHSALGVRISWTPIFIVPLIPCTTSSCCSFVNKGEDAMFAWIWSSYSHANTWNKSCSKIGSFLDQCHQHTNCLPFCSLIDIYSRTLT
jgi:hypothetical protein